jgi:hypothetical protein
MTPETRITYHLQKDGPGPRYPDKTPTSSDDPRQPSCNRLPRVLGLGWRVLLGSRHVGAGSGTRVPVDSGLLGLGRRRMWRSSLPLVSNPRVILSSRML